MTDLDKKINQVYYGLKHRCENKKNISYHIYGGKGIKAKITKEEIKEIWIRDSAKNMKCPSIDRKDSNDDYIFYNCRFIERSENSKNAQLGRKSRTPSNEMKSCTIYGRIPTSLKKRFNKALKILRTTQQFVIVDMVNKIIKEASNRD